MKNGYEVTFRDFQRLVSDPYCRPMVAPMLKEWFNYDIVELGPPTEKFGDPVTEIRDASAQVVDKLQLHLTIQADAEKQWSLYSTSQTLWR